MDCHKGLVLALGLAAGAVGCVPQTEMQTVPPPPPGVQVEKAREIPKHPPKNPETCVALGNVFAAEEGAAPQGSTKQEHLYDQARREYRQALDIDAKCSSAYLALGQLCTTRNDHDGAVKWYRKGLEKQPQAAPLWFNLGMCHARHKEWDAANDALRRAAELDPENQQNQNMLGYCLARSGHHDEALAVFRKNGGEAKARYNLARMLHHMNQDAEARQHLQAAVQAEPTFEPAQRLLAQLEGREPADPAVMQAGFDMPAGDPVPLR